MEELLNALKAGDCYAVDREANKLFITANEHWNLAQINEFEKYARCHILPINRAHYKFNCTAGLIRYSDRQYIFG